MNRLLLVAVCTIVVSFETVALGQYVVASPMPAAVYSPVPEAFPVTTFYAPFPSAYGRVVTYAPTVAPAPVAYGPPVVYPPQVAAYLWTTTVVRAKVYVSGQPVRNVLRAVTP